MMNTAVSEKSSDAPFLSVPLRFNNFTVLESCIHTRQNKDCQGSLFLDSHLIYYIHRGKNTFGYGKERYEVNAGELIVLPKSTVITYEKSGREEDGFLYHGVLFFLKDEFIVDFLRMSTPKPLATAPVQNELLVVKSVQDRLMKFFESTLPYFNEPEQIEEGLLRIKILELLYDLTSADHRFLSQILQLRQPPVADLSHVLETNFTNPVALKDLAYLSGRSLARFKRDFQQLYKVPPAQWLKEKRLNKARDLLHLGGMTVTEVCYATGFENVAHFSRVFKAHFGTPPSVAKLAQQV